MGTESLTDKVKNTINAIEIIDNQLSINDLLNSLLFESTKLFDADQGFIYLFENNESNNIGVLKTEELVNYSIEIIHNEQIKNKFPILIDRISNQDEHNILSTECNSGIIIPIISSKKYLGILYLESNKHSHFLHDIDIIKIFSNHAGIAINRIQLLKEQEVNQEFLESIASTVAIGQIATAFVHEIRNPLNAIALTIDNIKFKLENLNQIKNQRIILEKIEIIQNEILHIDSLTHRLQHFVQSKNPNKVYCYLNELLISSLKIVDNYFRDKKISTIIELDPTLSGTQQTESNSIYVDKRQIEHVIINIILNAIDASREGSTISFLTKKFDDHVELRVTDDGLGIKGEDRELIFRPWFSTKKDGVGLGLFVSKKIIENHNGQIGFQSNLGKGTSFYLSLPRRKI